MLKIQHLHDMQWIHVEDPALDFEAPGFDYGKFLKSWDRAFLPIREGYTPTVFTARRLGMKLAQHCFRQPHVPDRDRELVAYSLKAVEDFNDRAGAWPLKFEKGEFGEQRVTEASLEEIYSWDLFRELGASLMYFNKLRP